MTDAAIEPTADHANATTDTTSTSEPHWRVADMEDRVRAAAMDCVLVTVVGTLISFVLIVAGLWTDDGGAAHLSTSGALAMWLTATVYVGLAESRHGPKNGQTPGKRARGIRTVCARGGLPPNRPKIWVRAAVLGLLLPLGLPLAYLAAVVGGAEAKPGNPLCGFVVAVFVAVAASNQLRRSPHDWLCGTVVVDAFIIDPSLDENAAGSGPAQCGGRPPALPMRELPIVGLPDERNILIAALVFAAISAFLAAMPASS